MTFKYYSIHYKLFRKGKYNYIKNINYHNVYKLNIININIVIYYFEMGIGDWGLGIGDWGLGPIPNPQSPIPNPQSPIPIVIEIAIIFFI